MSALPSPLRPPPQPQPRTGDHRPPAANDTLKEDVMRNSLTIRRWRIDLHGNALYLQAGPKPSCKDCHGIGRTDAEAQGSDTETSDIKICDCWNPWGSRRIPIWFRRAERYPF